MGPRAAIAKTWGSAIFSKGKLCKTGGWRSTVVAIFQEAGIVKFEVVRDVAFPFLEEAVEETGVSSIDDVSLAVVKGMMDDLDTVSAKGPLGAVDPGDPVIHPPVTQGRGVVKVLAEDVHMGSMGKVMSQDFSIALGTAGSDGADVVK